MTKSRETSNTSPTRRRGAWARAAAALVWTCVLGGCSSDSDTNWPQIYEAAKASFTGDGSSITLQQAAAIPYASMGVRIGDSRQQLVVLASDMSGGRLWTSSARIALVTQDGRIMRTAGFVHNLDAMIISGNDPLASFGDVHASPQRTARQADFLDRNLFSVHLQCTLTSRGADPVTILGKRIATHRIDEDCRSRTLGWSFTNNFWMDRSGFVWKSIQYTHPDQDPLEIEVLRPPA